MFIYLEEFAEHFIKNDEYKLVMKVYSSCETPAYNGLPMYEVTLIVTKIGDASKERYNRFAPSKHLYNFAVKFAQNRGKIRNFADWIKFYNRWDSEKNVAAKLRRLEEAHKDFEDTVNYWSRDINCNGLFDSKSLDFSRQTLHDCYRALSNAVDDLRYIFGVTL